MFIYGYHVYKKPLRRLVAFDIDGVFSALDLLDDFITSRKNGYFVGYLTYEAGVLISTYNLSAYQMLHQRVKLSCKATYNMPLLHFTLFAKREPHRIHKNAPESRILRLYDIDSLKYQQKFHLIKSHIHKGDCYQVNFTDELLCASNTKPKALFHALLSRQDTPYKAYMSNPFVQILCFSPELFFRIKHGIITAKPMKGTIRRSYKAYEAKAIKCDNAQDSISRQNTSCNAKISDKKLRHLLQNDEKNRSENIMIVDLLRNDLSKVIDTQTLRVKNLCKVISYPSVHQMISTLQGRLTRDSIKDIFLAIFPCGSITGAPKLKTMEIIYDLESRVRGVYCGALGVISKKQTSFCVPIHTLVRYKNEAIYRYGVGSGVVWDSACEEEMQELHIKSQFLQSAHEPYWLFETMLYHKGHIFLLLEHLERMAQSAALLGFDTSQIYRIHNESAQNTAHAVATIAPNTFDFALTHYSTLTFHHVDSMWHKADTFFKALQEYAQVQIPQTLNDTSDKYILKISLSHKGILKCDIAPFVLHKTNKLRLSKKAINKHDTLIYHKTTFRTHFAKATKAIESKKVFDMIFTNTKGFITEGSRSNIVCEINGRFYTPPTRCGLLGGTLRKVLLDSGCIIEKKLRIKDIKNAHRIFCINAVRGIVEVKLD